jgi:peptidyl-tRNA hydrolase, PTH1 family
MYLIVGLGNPGARYARTRHNVGWMVLDELARRHHVDLSRKAHEAHLGSGLIGGHRVLLAKPLTFMNLSGRSVSALLRYHNVEPRHLLVVCDDLNLPLGRLRLRRGGSDGGHNGLKSISQTLSTIEYPRLRFGVGEPPREERMERGTADYVLSTFTPDEAGVVADVVARAAACAEVFMGEGVEAAMNRFNQ